MTGTAMIVSIVFISVGFGVIGSMYKRHMDFKEKALDLKNNNAEDDNDLAKTVSLLAERVQVLEKIVTDEGYSVQKEIKNL